MYRTLDPSKKRRHCNISPNGKKLDFDADLEKEFTFQANIKPFGKVSGINGIISILENGSKKVVLDLKFLPMSTKLAVTTQIDAVFL